MPRARHASAGWLAERRARERAHFERRYAGDETLSPVVVAEVLLRELRPCFETGGYKYSDNKQAFYELIERHGGWAGREHVLDYGCGVAGWSLYYALTGARRISGFDISQNAIRRGRERVRRQGYADRITLQVMDAADLGYASNTFDLVIGRAVLHHVIKYPRVFAEIHRVLRPGGSAWFMEGLADFPLWRLWWAWKPSHRPTQPTRATFPALNGTSCSCLSS